MDTSEKQDGWNSDPQIRRPGVPMEQAARPHRQTPLVRQMARVEVLKRVGLTELTPVFGTAQPPRGLSGVIRRLAYKIPEHRSEHWMALLVADRVDVIESHPAKFLGLLAGIIGGAVIVPRLVRRLS